MMYRRRQVTAVIGCRTGVHYGSLLRVFFFFFQAEDGIRDYKVTGVQTCALPIYGLSGHAIESARRSRHRREGPPAWIFTTPGSSELRFGLPHMTMARGKVLRRSSSARRRTTENCARSSRKSSVPSSDAVLITTVYLLRRRLRATMETHAHSLRLPSQLLEARGDGAGAGGHQPDLLAARPVDLPLHHR